MTEGVNDSIPGVPHELVQVAASTDVVDVQDATRALAAAVPAATVASAVPATGRPLRAIPFLIIIMILG